MTPDPIAVVGVKDSAALPEIVKSTNLSGGLDPDTSAAPPTPNRVPDPVQ
jgi:hypothetical protein